MHTAAVAAAVAALPDTLPISQAHTQSRSHSHSPTLPSSCKSHAQLVAQVSRLDYADVC